MINRFTNKINLNLTGPFIIIYGFVDDEFILNNLVYANIEELLWIFLKKQGFQRIVFFDNANKLYFYDNESYNLTYKNKNQYSFAENESEKSDNRPLGNLKFLKNQNINDKIYNDNILRKENIIKIPADDLNAIEILDAIANDTEIKTAIIFPHFEQLTFQERARIEFYNRLNKWIRLSSEIKNRFFLIFDFNEIESLLNSLLYNYNLSFIANYIERSKKNIGLENLIFINTPEEDEIKNLINKLRLRKNLKIEWLHIERIIELLSVESKTLKYWKAKMEEIIEKNEELNKKIVINFGIDKSYFDDRPAIEILNELIGLEEVKNKIKKQINLLHFKKKKNADIRLHLSFEGNPGTGKTTVARLIARIYREYGILKRGHLVEVDRGKLVGEHVGETAIKTHEKCKEALDGVLLIDEAYSLYRGNDDSFGMEAVDTLIKRMEDWKNRFMVIFTGYPDEMEKFLSSNPGIKRRIAERIIFEDYTPDQLLQIFYLKIKKENYKISKQLEQSIKNIFKNVYERRDKSFGNAGFVEQFIQDLEENYILRCVNNNLNVKNEQIKLEDIPDKYKKYLETGINQEELESALKELNNLIGLKEVKELIRKLIKKIKHYNKLSKNLDDIYLHLVFKGNPGTGKTTVARILGRIFKALGILKEGKVVEVKRNDLIGTYLGETAVKTDKKIKEALDSILFIDEAYSLVLDERDQYGKEAIAILLKNMEDYRNRLIVIVAGYSEDMDKFLNSNPGLPSRFTNEIIFKDYTVDELVEIFCCIAKNKGYKLAEGVREKLKEKIKILKSKKDKKFFGNAREIRNLFNEVEDNLILRTENLTTDNIIITKDDIIL